MVCLIDPVGDVYACPFVLHDEEALRQLEANGGALRPSVSVDHSKPGRKRIPVTVLC